MEWTPITCFMFEFLLETTPQIFHTASNWLTLALALQRYIYVCHPSLAKWTCTVRKARMVVMLVVGMALIHMMPRIFDRFYTVETIGSQTSFIVQVFIKFISEIPFLSDSQSVCLAHFAGWLNLLTLEIYFSLFFWFVDWTNGPYHCKCIQISQ